MENAKESFFLSLQAEQEAASVVEEELREQIKFLEQAVHSRSEKQHSHLNVLPSEPKKERSESPTPPKIDQGSIRTVPEVPKLLSLTRAAPPSHGSYEITHNDMRSPKSPPSPTRSLIRSALLLMSPKSPRTPLKGRRPTTPGFSVLALYIYIYSVQICVIKRGSVLVTGQRSYMSVIRRENDRKFTPQSLNLFFDLMCGNFAILFVPFQAELAMIEKELMEMATDLEVRREGLLQKMQENFDDVRTSTPIQIQHGSVGAITTSDATAHFRENQARSQRGQSALLHSSHGLSRSLSSSMEYGSGERSGTGNHVHIIAEGPTARKYSSSSYNEYLVTQLPRHHKLSPRQGSALAIIDEYLGESHPVCLP